MINTTTILCIDDDQDDLAFLQEAISLQSSEYLVREAKNGEEALAYLEDAKSKNELPGFIFMDINMPKMDGKKAIQMIKADEMLRHIPVAVFTTSSNIQDQEYFQHYNVHYITKPNHYGAFTSKVAEMLSQHLNGR